ncbi:MAG TPA: alpha/beta fold hydrolase [Caulobacteraceae bacterium]|nr:alpha/beta fold hydrolase [Caulobacteraceae bacterium]
MSGRRPRGFLSLGWACVECAATGRSEHRPTSAAYPDSVVQRFNFSAGGSLGWRLSALRTPRPRKAPWKIVVITGAPSWAEYWAPTLAALPQDREMIVVDRPGFACSEPATCVPDIAVQARALEPLLRTRPGQKLLLVGQSYGGAIAALMAPQAKRLGGLVLLSAYLGEPGPTARWLVGAGARVLSVIPRDLRNAVIEVSGQRAQLASARTALGQIAAPVHMIHGDADDFAPLATARRFAADAPTKTPVRFEVAAGADHFLADGPAERLVDIIERCIPAAPLRPRWSWPRLFGTDAPALARAGG